MQNMQPVSTVGMTAQRMTNESDAIDSGSGMEAIDQFLGQKQKDHHFGVPHEPLASDAI